VSEFLSLIIATTLPVDKRRRNGVDVCPWFATSLVTSRTGLASQVASQFTGRGRLKEGFSNTEGEGFEPPKACTLVVFKAACERPPTFVIVRHSSPCIERARLSSADVR